MFQLLSPHVRIYDPMKDKWSVRRNVANVRRGAGACRRDYGAHGRYMDNIPGVKGIGEKTAMKLITQFGTIEELLRRVEEVTPPGSKRYSSNRLTMHGSAGSWRPSNSIVL